MMETEVNQLFSEIRQLVVQYKAEVSSVRKPWPRSIKERVVRLSKLGIKNQKIGDETGLSMNTIYSWLTRGKEKAPTFVPLTVKSREMVPAQPCTETRAILTVTVVINSRIRIEGYPVDQIVRLIETVGESA
jgi:hypothetical protein